MKNNHTPSNNKPIESDDQHFDYALNKLIGLEGKYAPPLLYPEGETYKGITRKNHAYWPGWEIIDHQKPRNNFPDSLETIDDLQILVSTFYHSRYWKPNRLDEISHIDHQIAFEVLEMAVHAGPKTAVKQLQKALNLLNKNQKLYSNIAQDGVIGAYTLHTLKTALNYNPNTRIVFFMEIQQACYYFHLWEKDETREEYLGWLKRLAIKTEPY